MPDNVPAFAVDQQGKETLTRDREETTRRVADVVNPSKVVRRENTLTRFGDYLPVIILRSVLVRKEGVFQNLLTDFPIIIRLRLT